MTIQEQIEAYIASQSEPKRSDMQALHVLILQVRPACTLWFLDGKDDKGKTVSNPNIGYGNKLGKASVSGYCIKFKTLKDINLEMLEAAIRDGFAISNG